VSIKFTLCVHSDSTLINVCAKFLRNGFRYLRGNGAQQMANNRYRYMLAGG